MIPVIISGCVSISERYGKFIDKEHKLGPFYLNRSYTEEKIKQKAEMPIYDEETERQLEQVEIGFNIRF